MAEFLKISGKGFIFVKDSIRVALLFFMILVFLVHIPVWVWMYQHSNDPGNILRQPEYFTLFILWITLVMFLPVLAIEMLIELFKD